MSVDPEPQAIVIAGYYRSGTSALSGSLARLGVTVIDEAEANEFNPRGYFEIPELIAADLNILAALGLEWSDVMGPREGWTERADMVPLANQLHEVMVKRFGTSKMWAVKHPPICRLLPLYARAIARIARKTSVLHIVREPYVVTDSQRKKNGLSRSHALLLWCAHVIEAERNARPFPRGWLTYEDLLHKPRQALERALHDADIQAPKATFGEVEKFLSKTLNRSASVDSSGVYPPLAQLVGDVWDLARAEYGPGSAARWDSLVPRVEALNDFVTELGRTQCRAAPGVGTGGMSARPAGTIMAVGQGRAVSLRPAERTDLAARERLLARLAKVRIPTVTVIVACPQGAIGELDASTSSIRDQWRQPDAIHILTVDAVDAADEQFARYHRCEAGSEYLAKLAGLMETAGTEYVAVLTASDRLEPDALARLLLTAATTNADIIYTDEVVMRPGAPWIRHKPVWDIERHRRSAYIGDWVWYRTGTIRSVGGISRTLEGAEEHDLQLRIGEAGGRIERLPEALYIRSNGSRRDDIPFETAFANGAKAVEQHLQRQGIDATVSKGAIPATFAIGLPPSRSVADIGIVVDCSRGTPDQLKLLASKIFHGAYPDDVLIFQRPAGQSAEMNAFLDQVEVTEFGGRVAVVSGAEPPDKIASALLGRFTAKAFLFLRADAMPEQEGWLTTMRRTLDIPGTGIVGAKAVAGRANLPGQRFLVGPLIPGAMSRLGNGRAADDVGPGAWLGVAHRVDALDPPGLMIRRECLEEGIKEGAATWAELCLNVGRTNAVLWLPEVTFDCGVMQEGQDAELAYTQSLATPAKYHHPALSLYVDPLSPSNNPGLVPDCPDDPMSNLITGAACPAVLDAARAVRRAGAGQLSWSPEQIMMSEIRRLAAKRWIRLNPVLPAVTDGPSWTGVWSSMPAAGTMDAVRQAGKAYGTSPGIVSALKGMGGKALLWRPTISREIWKPYEAATALNTNVRVLWCDEGIQPSWFVDLINRTAKTLTWIVVESPGVTYSGSVTRLARPQSEAEWASVLAAVAPQVMVRPAVKGTAADRFLPLMAAAAGCALYLNEDLDFPDDIPLTTLPDKLPDWERVLTTIVSRLPSVLETGMATRETILKGRYWTEKNLPPWCACEAVDIGSADSLAAQ